jgi:RNA polymerase sigma-70 factor (ECF subfamily)
MAANNLNNLINLVAQGDQKAFGDLFRLFSSKVYVFAFRLTHSKPLAEDVLQEVFIKIWENRVALKKVEYFPSYLYAVTRNHSFNILKKMALELKAKTYLADHQETADRQTEETVIYRDHQHILNRLVDQLPPQQKLVYSLCHGEGLKYEEAAQRLKLSRLTVKTHMQHALRTIKSNFSHYTHGLILIFCLS